MEAGRKLGESGRGQMRHRNQLHTSIDLDGVTTNVRVMSFSDRAQWEDVKHKTIFDCTFSLYDSRPGKSNRSWQPYKSQSGSMWVGSGTAVRGNQT